VTSTEKVRAWRAANRERQQHNQRAYAAKHAVKIAAAHASRYAADRDAVKQRVRAARYMRLYGITIAQFDKMIELQGGVCAICGREPTPGRRLHADHCHRTKRVRGGLCAFCNMRTVGRGADDSQLHESAAAYLLSDFDARNL